MYGEETQSHPSSSSSSSSDASAGNVDLGVGVDDLGVGADDLGVGVVDDLGVVVGAVWVSSSNGSSSSSCDGDETSFRGA